MATPTVSWTAARAEIDAARGDDPERRVPWSFTALGRTGSASYDGVLQNGACGWRRWWRGPRRQHVVDLAARRDGTANFGRAVRMAAWAPLAASVAVGLFVA